MKLNQRKPSTVKMTAELDSADLWELVKLKAVPRVGKIVGPVRVYIEVPGGGDWSNSPLDVTADRPVIVEWEQGM